MNLLMAIFTTVNPSVVDEPDARVRAEALAWVNMIREEYGVKACPRLLPGVRQSATHCVMSRMLKPIAPRVVVGPTDVVQTGHPMVRHYAVRIRQWDGGCVSRPCPPLVEEFLRRFDLGLFPDLETNLFTVELDESFVANLQVT